MDDDTDFDLMDEMDENFANKIILSHAEERTNYSEVEFRGLNGKDLVEIEMENFANEISEAEIEYKREFPTGNNIENNIKNNYDDEESSDDELIVQTVVDKILDYVSEEDYDDELIVQTVVGKMVDYVSDEDYEPHTPEPSDDEDDMENSSGNEINKNLMQNEIEIAQSQGFSTSQFEKLFQQWKEMQEENANEIQSDEEMAQIVPEYEKKSENRNEEYEIIDISSDDENIYSPKSPKDEVTEDGQVPKNIEKIDFEEENFYQDAPIQLKPNRRSILRLGLSRMQKVGRLHHLLAKP